MNRRQAAAIERAACELDLLEMDCRVFADRCSGERRLRWLARAGAFRIAAEVVREYGDYEDDGVADRLLSKSILRRSRP